MNNKQETRNRNQETMIVRAESSVIRQSVRKMQLVTRAISGMTPATAVEVLQFMDKKAAEPIGKTIQQAIANATNNLKIAESSFGRLLVELQEGPTMKRWRMGSRGRTKPILKRTGKIVVKLFVKINEQKTKNK
ncbi:50S ribosomal protein L22 [Candidatus Collierbacteria bacterium]|nr:50S ribosomal protein L22 [Candidatus Collierbacteria bacterium]